MGGLAYRYVIVIVCLCISIVPHTIGVITTASDHSPRVTADQRARDIDWKVAISGSTPTVSNSSTSSATFSERNEHTPTRDPGCRDDNATHVCMNASAGPGLGLLHEVSFAVDVINRVQLAISSAGFFANAATYLTLTFNGGRFSPLILLLIKHQALLDMGVCGMGSL